MSHHHRDRLVATVCGLAVLAAGGLLTAGCASAQPSTPSATAATSTPSLTYAAQGRHAVGYRVFTTTGAQQQPLTLRAWFPAQRPDNKRPATITYAAPNKFDEQIMPGKDITAVGGALANGRPERTGRPYPLAVFTHGYALSPIVYSRLVEHYASHGYVVLAPEHNETFDQSLTGFWRALIDRPVDVHRTIEYAELLTKPGAPLAGLIDMGKIAVIGHSYGGYTALAAAGARFDFAPPRQRRVQHNYSALTGDQPRKRREALGLGASTAHPTRHRPERHAGECSLAQTIAPDRCQSDHGSAMTDLMTEGRPWRCAVSIRSTGHDLASR